MQKLVMSKNRVRGSLEEREGAIPLLYGARSRTVREHSPIKRNSIR
jgi:hypothetical protein